MSQSFNIDQFMDFYYEYRKEHADLFVGKSEKEIDEIILNAWQEVCEEDEDRAYDEWKDRELN